MKIRRPTLSTLSAVLIATTLASCEHLEFGLTSVPANLPVRFCDEPTGWRTPVRMDVPGSRLGWKRTVSVSCGKDTRTVTLDTFCPGFKGGWGHWINSLAYTGAAAWVHVGSNEIEMAFPDPGKVLVTYDVQRSSDYWTELHINGELANQNTKKANYSRFRRAGLAIVEAGRLRLLSKAWSMDASIPDLTRVSTSWGKSSYRPEFRFALDHSRFRSGSLVIDGEQKIDLRKVAGDPIYIGLRFELELEDNKHQKYSLAVSLEEGTTLTLVLARD